MKSPLPSCFPCGFPALFLFLAEKRNLIMRKNKKKGNNPSKMRCPYCGAPMILRSADGIYKDNSRHNTLYVCRNYPECDTYVRTRPGTAQPLGTPANRELRALRIQAHRCFDAIHQNGYMVKRDAYIWLANLLQVPQSQAHIGYLGEYSCRKVIEESMLMLKRYQQGRSDCDQGVNS